MKWYAIHTYSGFEKKVKKDIEHVASIEGLRNELGRVTVLEEKVQEIKDGKRKEHTRNIMPGYVFVEMNDDERLFKVVEEIKGVSRFVGASGARTPLTKEEVDNILSHIEEKKEAPRKEVKYSIGDKVKVTEGNFANFVGTIEEIDHEKAKLKLAVSIFGRSTPLEVHAYQVEAAT
ncbi:MAG: transcription termination/antitermination protein NusG [Sumerlaeia bacterium]